MAQCHSGKKFVYSYLNNYLHEASKSHLHHVCMYERRFKYLIKPKARTTVVYIYTNVCKFSVHMQDKPVGIIETNTDFPSANQYLNCFR